MQKLTITILFPALIWLIAGCQPPSTGVPSDVPQPTPAIEVTIVVKEIGSPSPTPAVCTPLPDGMKLTVEPISAESVQVQLVGLLPGESLTLLFVAKPTATESMEIEATFSNAVEPDGSFAHQKRWLPRLKDATENTWTVKVIHSRGVACQDVTLP